jgi:hypothetical protein
MQFVVLAGARGVLLLCNGVSLTHTLSCNYNYYCTGMRSTDAEDRLQPMQVGVLMDLMRDNFYTKCKWGSDSRRGWRGQPSEILDDAEVSPLPV